MSMGGRTRTVLFAVLGSMLALPLVVHSQPQRQPVDTAGHVAVAVFTNVTGEQVDAWIGFGIAESVAIDLGGSGTMEGLDVVVFSRTLQPADYPDVTIVGRDPAESVRSLKARPGKDIWLFGGGELFRTLLEAGLVDTVEAAVVPVLLGKGVPMLPSCDLRTTLTLTRHHLYAKSGIVLLEYAVS